MLNLSRLQGPTHKDRLGLQDDQEAGGWSSGPQEAARNAEKTQTFPPISGEVS